MLLTPKEAAVRLKVWPGGVSTPGDFPRQTISFYRGVTKKLWEVSDLVALWEADEAKTKSGATDSK